MNRPVLSVFNAVYRYISAHYFKPAVLWESVREELTVFRGLMIFLHADWGRPWNTYVTATDSSLEGYGVVSSQWLQHEVANVGRNLERARFRKLGSHSARASALTSAGFVHDETTDRWKAGWKYPDIYCGECAPAASAKGGGFGDPTCSQCIQPTGSAFGKGLNQELETRRPLLERRARRRAKAIVDHRLDGLTLLEQNAVGDSTSKQYQKEMNSFLRLAKPRRLKKTIPTSVDDLLVDYLNRMYLDGYQSYRGDRLLAAVLHNLESAEGLQETHPWPWEEPARVPFGPLGSVCGGAETAEASEDGTLPSHRGEHLRQACGCEPECSALCGRRDQDAFKEKARRALLKPQYNVLDYYHTSGICQRIARSLWNAIWISIDIDYNESILLMEADTVFQVVEHTFCTYFFFEISIRFGAFARKRQAFLDPWFLFDLLLVTNMVAETWLVPIVISILGDGANVLNVSFLRMMRAMARMVKLLRLSRVTRFIRAVPELIIIVKAMGFAARSVLVFFFVWLVIIYVYAVVLRQATDGSDVGILLFPSVPDAMNSLLLDGLLADYAPFMKTLGSAGVLLYIVGLTYILLVAVTVMYMLVGCLVEAVGAIASSQKEGLVVSYVAGSIRNKMELLGHNPEAPISQQDRRCRRHRMHRLWLCRALGRRNAYTLCKPDFQNYLTDPEVTGILASVKVDVVVLADMLEMFYEDLERTGDVMTFEKMVELMLNGRGSNTATVRDTKELLRMIKSAIRVQTAETTKKLAEELSSVHQTINAMREEGDDPKVSKSRVGLAPPQPTSSAHLSVKGW
eukprot:s1194_g4.t1